MIRTVKIYRTLTHRGGATEETSTTQMMDEQAWRNFEEQAESLGYVKRTIVNGKAVNVKQYEVVRTQPDTVKKTTPKQVDNSEELEQLKAEIAALKAVNKQVINKTNKNK